jgi:hypothetical protein
MALLFVDGFDNCNTIGYGTTNPKGWTSGNNLNKTLATGRFGNGLCITTQSGDVIQRSLSNKQILYIGFAYYTTLAANNVFAFMDTTTYQLRVKMDVMGKLYFTNGASTVTYTDTLSSSIKIRSGVWEFIEIMATISSSIGSDSCIIRINGTQVANLTSGQNTQASANAYTNKLEFTFNGGATYMDDFYMLDNTGAANNTFIGDCRVATLYPNGNGTYSQFVGSDSNSTDNYALVDETQYNSTDYVDGAINNIDTYAFGDLPTNTTSIYGVQRSIYSMKTDAGTRKITPITRIGGTDYLGASEIDLTAGWYYALQMLELDPSTSAAWGVTNVNAAEYGSKVTT